MDPYDHSAAPHRHNVFDTTRDWNYVAAHKVAAEEHDEQLIAEAELQLGRAVGDAVIAQAA